MEAAQHLQAVKRAVGGLVLLAALTPVIVTSGHGQTFTRVLDPFNPVVTDVHVNNYTGAAWFDYDGDGRLDLIVTGWGNNFLYHNEGFGNFSAPLGNPIAADTRQYRGVSCADYDNDGDADCFLAATNQSSLYRNDGGTLVRVSDADLGDPDLRGWSPAWGDYNDDGYLDLYITFPTGFVPGSPRPSRLLLNDGPPNFTFTPVDTGVVASVLAPYTSGNWSDYDQDGDLDLFVGAGPANGQVKPDYLYRNLLTETGVPGFERILDTPIASDKADGQVINLVDYDNDGDFDLHRTNWGGAGTVAIRPNDLYRNDGGVYTPITTGQIATDAFVSLGALWEDFDNDGDLDCFVTNISAPDNFYRNDGGGVFTRIAAGDAGVGSFNHTGSTAGDYDNDGDLDIFAVGAGTDQRSLLFNETDNGNGWLKIKLQGVYSNADAVGARVRLKATIGGVSTWQLREVSAQNSFLCHSSLLVHFGLGDAATIDSIQVLWPSGVVNDTAAVGINQQIVLVEHCDDTDGDGVACFDNCPNMANPDQADSDGDGTGDLCDACPLDAENDMDGDGLCADVDNCPQVANADQLDTDGDDLGDVCDACLLDPENDIDGDGLCAELDNCPLVANVDQADFNSDGIGDACCCESPGDASGDGATNVSDLTFLVNYLFKSGAAAPCPAGGDVNGDTTTNVSDLTGLVNYLFKAGVAPICP